MLTVDPHDVIKLRTPGGERFNAFVDLLLRTHARALGIPDTEIRTNVRQNLADGGVDSSITAPASLRDPHGYLGAPTAWQYKSREFSGMSTADFTDEVEKIESARLIKAGYVYFFCIADDAAPERINGFEDACTTVARGLDATAYPVRILTASRLAALASSYPALVLACFNPQLATLGVSLSTAGQNLVAVTPSYVSVPDWAPAQQRIATHVDLSRPCPDVVLAVQGQAGVGKTRFVYEALIAAGIPAGMVLWTVEQGAQQAAFYLANTSGSRAILVADECSVSLRSRISESLRGSRDRVRVIAIDNTGDRMGASLDLWLDPLPLAQAESVIDKNFSHVPKDRRQEYLGLSKGYIRLVADLCHIDPLARGPHKGALPSLHEYLVSRLPAAALDAACAIALFTRVGAFGDKTHELSAVCAVLKIDESTARRDLARAKDSPGFVVRAGRYYYISPEVVARALLARAWQMWTGSDLPSFVASLPPLLLESFQKRVASSGEDRHRFEASTHFLAWANSLSPKDLADTSTVERLVALVAVSPDVYAERLADLIEAATPDEVTALSRETGAAWSPRRKLLFLVERLRQYPEHFLVVERVSYALAQNETERGVANSSNAIWSDLFRVIDCETGASFQKRIDRLGVRLQQGDESLIAAAIAKMLRPHNVRTVRRDPIGGATAPFPELPASPAEYRLALLTAAHFLAKAAEGPRPTIATAGREVLISGLRILLAGGLLGEIRELLRRLLAGHSMGPVLDELSLFLTHDALQTQVREALSPSYVEDVRQWAGSLVPADFHSRLTAAVGRSYWLRHVDKSDEQHRRILTELSHDLLVASPETQATEVGWLANTGGVSFDFGAALGSLEGSEAMLHMVTGAAASTRGSLFARGFLGGLLSRTGAHDPEVNSVLDRMQATSPEATADLLVVAPTRLRTQERLLAMLRAGALPAPHDRFAWLLFQTLEEFGANLESLLLSLVDLSATQPGIAAEVTAELLFAMGDRGTYIWSVLVKEPVRRLLARVVDYSGQKSGRHQHYWETFVRGILTADRDWAISLASGAVVSDVMFVRDAAIEFLTELAPSEPERILSRLGEVMLDPELGVQFFIDDYSGLFAALPEENLRAWLERVGVEGARRMARHLPKPRIENGLPLVAPITAFVLERFEADDRVFREFRAGMGSFSMVGNIAAAHGREAELARAFLGHPLRRVRQWAKEHLASSSAIEGEWRQMEEEEDLE